MKLQLKFDSDTRQLAAMRHTVREFLEAYGLQEMDCELIVLALDEACTNIIRYAYQGCRERPIRVNLDLVRNRLCCTLRDYGATCDPSRIRGRDLTDFKPGGLGVRIMRTAFDEVEYEPMPRGTRLTLVKDLAASAEVPGDPPSPCGATADKK